jgi:hypothetical protein
LLYYIQAGRQAGTYNALACRLHAEKQKKRMSHQVSLPPMRTTISIAINSQLKLDFCHQIAYLGFALIITISAIFLMAFVAAHMAQTTDSVSGALHATHASGAGAGEIVRTAEAEEAIPVALSPILDQEQMGRVKELTISNLGSFPAGGNPESLTPCASCAKTMVVQVDVAIKYNDTLAMFTQTDGIEIMIDKGLITAVNVPFQDPRQVFVACGSATCSSIWIAGMNVGEMRQKAQSLSYINTGTSGRRDLMFHRGSAARASQRRLFFLAIGAPFAMKAVAVCAIAAGVYGMKKGVQMGEYNAKVAAGVPTPPMSKTDKTIGKIAGKIFRL